MSKGQKIFLTIGLGFGWAGVIVAVTMLLPFPFGVIISLILAWFIVAPTYEVIWKDKDEDA